MSERGVFALDRGWFGHPCFADEPFTEREAWAWLISEASFKPRVKRIGSVVVPLERGQVAASLRFMAEAWQWEHTRVRRFLGRLKTATMIEQQIEHGITVLTICNYNKYQRVSLPAATVDETENATAAQQQRNKLEDTKTLELDGGGEKRAKLISDEAQDTADALASACGFADPKNCPIGWYGAAIWVQKCLSEGWPAELMILGTKETARRKRDGPIESYKYLEKPLARFIAEQSRPLPKVEVREAETVVIHDGRTGIQKAESLSNVARRHAEAGISFGERPTVSGLRINEGGDPIRMLPKGGR